MGASEKMRYISVQYDNIINGFDIKKTYKKKQLTSLYKNMKRITSVLRGKQL